MKWYGQKQQFQMPVELMYSIEKALEGGKKCEEMTFRLPQWDMNLPIKATALVCVSQNAWQLVDTVNV